MISDTPVDIVERMQSLRIPRILRVTASKCVVDFIKQIPLHQSLLQKVLIKCDCKGSYRLRWGMPHYNGRVYVSQMIIDASGDAAQDRIVRNAYFKEVRRTYTHVALSEFASEVIADGSCFVVYRIALDTHTVSKRYYDSDIRYAYTLRKNDKDLHV